MDYHNKFCSSTDGVFWKSTRPRFILTELHELRRSLRGRALSAVKAGGGLQDTGSQLHYLQVAVLTFAVAFQVDVTVAFQVDVHFRLSGRCRVDMLFPPPSQLQAAASRTPRRTKRLPESPFLLDSYHVSTIYVMNAMQVYVARPCFVGGEADGRQRPQGCLAAQRGRQDQRPHAAPDGQDGAQGVIPLLWGASMTT